MIGCCYPHMPIGKVWIYRLLFVFLCVFVLLRISSPMIKLAESNFARRFIGVQGRKSPILGNFAPQKPKIGRIGQRVKDDECSSWWLHSVTCALATRTIGMCGYTAVSEDGRTCLEHSVQINVGLGKTNAQLYSIRAAAQAPCQKNST